MTLIEQPEMILSVTDQMRRQNGSEHAVESLTATAWRFNGLVGRPQRLHTLGLRQTPLGPAPHPANSRCEHFLALSLDSKHFPRFCCGGASLLAGVSSARSWTRTR